LKLAEGSSPPPPQVGFSEFVGVFVDVVVVALSSTCRATRLSSDGDDMTAVAEMTSVCA